MATLAPLQVERMINSALKIARPGLDVVGPMSNAITPVQLLQREAARLAESAKTTMPFQFSDCANLTSGIISASRALDSMQISASITSLVGVDLRTFHEVLTSQLLELEPPLQVTRDTPTSVEDCDLAAEVQYCAIELLAFLKEDELPDWMASNRKMLAWNLAVAAHDFMLDLMRATGRSLELYSPNSSASNSRFAPLPRH